MSRYQHPIFPRKDSFARAGIFKSGEKDPDKAFPLKQGVLDEAQITFDLDEFFADLRKTEEYRVKLGIPPMSYHAYSFKRPYNNNQVRRLIEYARSVSQELRVWHNEESAHLVVCLVDPDLSEDSGWTLYELMQTVGYDSYGLASWYEFVAYGVPIPDEWQLIERNGELFAESPDEAQITFF